LQLKFQKNRFKYFNNLLKTKTMNDTSKVLLAALGGAAVGAGIALLFAPASGKETRDRIKNRVTDAKDGLNNLVSEGKNYVRQATGRVREEFEDVARDGRQAVNNASHAVHNQVNNAGKKVREDMKEI
jgi:gas vesicle protein